MSAPLNTLNEAEAYILRTLREVHFGNIEVTIHDKQIVQVEKSEKKRFKQDGTSSSV